MLQNMEVMTQGNFLDHKCLFFVKYGHKEKDKRGGGGGVGGWGQNVTEDNLYFHSCVLCVGRYTAKIFHFTISLQMLLSISGSRAPRVLLCKSKQ